MADVPGMDGGPGAGDVGFPVPWFRRGSAAWLALAAVILVWDLTAADEQTLSEVFRRHKESPVARAVVVVIWVMLTGHLFGVLPRRADPWHAVYVCRNARRGVVPNADVCLQGASQEPV